MRINYKHYSEISFIWKRKTILWFAIMFYINVMINVYVFSFGIYFW